MLIAVLVLASFAPGTARGQTPDTARVRAAFADRGVLGRDLPTSASVSNPALSVIGWFQAVSGNDPTAQEEPFAMREVEIGLQAAVDPFTRADFFLSAGHGGLEIEEATITWLALPGGAQAKLGKFRADLGRFNRTHPAETPFADRPLSTVAFLGEEGLATAGAAISALIPNPLGLYWDLVGNVGAAPDREESPLFAAASRSDLLLVGRSSLFVPLRESADLHLGLSYANARARPDLGREASRAQLGAADLTFRWKSPRRSIYRSLMAQAELMAEQGSGVDAERRDGAFGYLLYQVARQWRVGARYDWTERPDEPGRARGGLALIQFKPSEFSTMSLQSRRVRDVAGERDLDALFFKWTFNIGPHGAEPY